MLDDFTETTSPDNRPLSTEDDVGNIIRGSTCTHLFRLPAATADIKDYMVSYKQGTTIVLEKSLAECEIVSLDIGDYAKVVMEPSQSKLFSSFYKYAYAQAAFLLKDDVTILYRPMHTIEVFDSVNDEPFVEDIPD